MKLTEPELKVRNVVAVRQALDALQQRNADDLLKPVDVVSAAEDEDSPLHACFEWDDGVAGHKYRLVQARHLISMHVVYADDDHESSLPRFVSLASDRLRPGGGYRSTSQVVKSKELLAELEETARRDVDALLKRYEMLKRFVSRIRAAAGIKARAKKK